MSMEGLRGLLKWPAAAGGGGGPATAGPATAGPAGAHAMTASSLLGAPRGGIEVMPRSHSSLYKGYEGFRAGAEDGGEDGGEDGALYKGFLATESAASGLDPGASASTQLVYALRDLHPCWRSCKRVPALLLTLGVELVVAFVIAEYAQSDVFRRYPLLMSFQPVVSALSGNIGLQASSVNTREVAVGMHDAKEGKKRQSICTSIWPELLSSSVLSMKIGAMLGLISFFWYMPKGADASDHTMHGAVIFGTAIAVGQCVSGLCAALTGSLAPIAFSRLGFDPTAMAGPMETAVQDVIGGTLLLMFSAWMLTNFGDFGAGCPGGNMKACVTSCYVSMTADGLHEMYNQTCLHNCVALDMANIC